MFDLWYMEHRAREAMEPVTTWDIEIAHYLREQSRDGTSPSLRRRLASVMVGMGLKLDPEVPLAIAPRRLVLEGANVHD